MQSLNLIPVFIVGLAGSIHCVGMCGGIVSAFSMAPSRAPFPVPIVTHSMALPAASPQAAALTRVVAYNTGRIASYALAGMLAGGLGGGVRTLAGLAPLQAGGYWAANLLLVLLGLHLAGAWSGLARIEQLGQALWRRLRPAMGKLLPVDTHLKLLALGALWGWLPCGMVYTVLLSAAMAGSAAGGAAVMTAFGIGTLPMLLTLGLAGARLRKAMQAPRVRLVSALVVGGFGLLGIARAAGGKLPGWMDILCLTVVPS